MQALSVFLQFTLQRCQGVSRDAIGAHGEHKRHRFLCGLQPRLDPITMPSLFLGIGEGLLAYRPQPAPSGRNRVNHTGRIRNPIVSRDVLICEPEPLAAFM